MVSRDVTAFNQSINQSGSQSVNPYRAARTGPHHHTQSPLANSHLTSRNGLVKATSPTSAEPNSTCVFGSDKRISTSRKSGSHQPPKPNQTEPTQQFCFFSRISPKFNPSWLERNLPNTYTYIHAYRYLQYKTYNTTYGPFPYQMRRKKMK